MSGDRELPVEEIWLGQCVDGSFHQGGVFLERIISDEWRICAGHD